MINFIVRQNVKISDLMRFQYINISGTVSSEPMLKCSLKFYAV